MIARSDDESGDDASDASGEPGSHGAVDDIDVTHRQLRSAIEFAVAAATEVSRQGVPYPPELAPMLRRRRLVGPELGRARRAIVGAPGFRWAVGALDGVEQVDELGRLWLQRPSGWQARAELVVRLEQLGQEHAETERQLNRERKRREAAEQKFRKATDANADADERLAAIEARSHDREAELAARDAELGAMRETVQAAKTAERHARDRQRAADERLARSAEELDVATDRIAALEHQRDELLATRIKTETGSPLGALSLKELRDVADQIRHLSRRLSDAVAPATTARVPIAIPGRMLGDRSATAEHLMRKSALVVVDGYNVAKLVWPSLELSGQRDRLIEVADNLARRFAATIVVVFDGTDVVGAATPARRLVRVVYSPPGVSADDVIRSEVAGTPAEQSITVVTNDREIQRDVARVGANVLSSDAFGALGLG